jgi:orotate phosphoribosyltransferase
LPELFKLVSRKQGHFRLESGYHAESWLDLDQLYLRPAALRPFAAELGSKISRYRIDGVCGPFSGGAFLAQVIAEGLGIEFAFAERIVTDRVGLYPVDYRIAPALRGAMAGKRVAIVDDAISAGSAVRATMTDLESCGAVPVVLGALILFGPRGRALAAEKQIPIECLVDLPNPVWAPTECPTCALGAPLTTP